MDSRFRYEVSHVVMNCRDPQESLRALRALGACREHGRVAARLVCIRGDFVNWHGACSVDWVEAKCRAQHRHSNSAQNTLRDQCGDVHACVGSMVCGV